MLQSKMVLAVVREATLAKPKTHDQMGKVIGWTCESCNAAFTLPPIFEANPLKLGPRLHAKLVPRLFLAEVLLLWFQGRPRSKGCHPQLSEEVHGKCNLRALPGREKKLLLPGLPAAGAIPVPHVHTCTLSDDDASAQAQLMAACPWLDERSQSRGSTPFLFSRCRFFSKSKASNRSKHFAVFLKPPFLQGFTPHAASGRCLLQHCSLVAGPPGRYLRA